MSIFLSLSFYFDKITCTWGKIKCCWQPDIVYCFIIFGANATIMSLSYQLPRTIFSSLESQAFQDPGWRSKAFFVNILGERTFTSPYWSSWNWLWSGAESGYSLALKNDTLINIFLSLVCMPFMWDSTKQLSR